MKVYDIKSVILFVHFEIDRPILITLYKMIKALDIFFWSYD